MLEGDRTTSWEESSPVRCSYSGDAGKVNHGEFSENVEATTARLHVRRCTLAAPTPHRLSDTSEVAVLSGEQRMSVPTLVLNSLQSENAHHGQYDSGDIPPLTAWFFSSALRNVDHYKWMFYKPLDALTTCRRKNNADKTACAAELTARKFHSI